MPHRPPQGSPRPSCTGTTTGSVLRGQKRKGTTWTRELSRTPTTSQTWRQARSLHGWKTLRTDNLRYVVEADGKEMLFDLDADPHAYVDVAGQESYAATLADARHQLLQRLLDRERPKARVWPY